MTPELLAALLAGCRWLIYCAVLGLVGTAGVRLVVRRVPSGSFDPLRATLNERLARSAAMLAALWIIALVATLALTVVSWFGPGGLSDFERVRAMLFETRWGHSWLLTFGAAMVAWLGLLAALRMPAVRPAALRVAPLAAILPTPLIGHGAGYGSLMWSLHVAHLAGTGLWLGTLLMLAWHTRSLWRTESASTDALGQTLRAFTPVALSGAAIAVLSGLGMSMMHVWPPQSVFDTPYGTTLTVKILTVSVIAALGWLNWRKLGPQGERKDRRRRLRTAVAAELALGFLVVLLLTAWLAGLPTPA